MKEVALDYVIDLERVIKKSKSKPLTKKAEEEQLEANYIIETFSEKTGMESNKIKEAKIKKMETSFILTKESGKPKFKTRRVVKYIVLSKKDKLEIIKQLTIEIKCKGNREIFRDIKIFENKDLLKLGYLNEDETINYNNPLVKKLVPKNK